MAPPMRLRSSGASRALVPTAAAGRSVFHTRPRFFSDSPSP